jgi:outer membrane protein TolC
VSAGDAAALELQLADAEAGRLRAARSAAQRDARLAEEELAREFPGLPARLPATLDPPPELPGDDPSWTAQIVADNHEIELAEARREEASLAAERATRDRLADPILGLRYSDNMDGDRRVVGLSFRLPLGGAGRAADAALARSAARAAEGEALRAGDRVNAAARAAVADARQSHASWRDQQAAFTVQQAAADATAKGYALGEFDISVLLTARRGALEAEQELLLALIRAQWSYARVLLDAHRLWAPPGHTGED